jgi:hypothetical protein
MYCNDDELLFIFWRYFHFFLLPRVQGESILYLDPTGSVNFTPAPDKLTPLGQPAEIGQLERLLEE